MAKPATVWCVANNRGHLLLGTVRRMRVESIREMVGPEEGWRDRWRWWKRQCGCRCVRVDITPTTRGPSDG